MRRLLFAISLLGLAVLPVAARADLVVVANPQSGIERLSKEDVINIYLGRYRRLPSGITAEPIDLAPADGTKERFYRSLVRKSLPEINAYWARLVFAGKTRPPQVAESSAAALHKVAADPAGIAYMDRSQTGRQVKVVFELSD